MQTTIEPLLILVLLLSVKHFLADFPLQTAIMTLGIYKFCKREPRVFPPYTQVIDVLLWRISQSSSIDLDTTRCNGLLVQLIRERRRQG